MGWGGGGGETRTTSDVQTLWALNMSVGTLVADKRRHLFLEGFLCEPVWPKR